ncbi:MAG: hypothetical protein IMX05_01405 [Hydrogenibacillus schlegelii]|nr:hypothetical protein [Hydrogenibacillus schlegelii]
MDAFITHIKYIAGSYKQGQISVPVPFTAVVTAKPERGKKDGITLIAATRYMMLKYASDRRSDQKEMASIFDYVARKAGRLTEGIAMTPPGHLTIEEFRARFDIVEQIDLKVAKKLTKTPWLVDVEIAKPFEDRGPNFERNVRNIFCDGDGKAYTVPKSMLDIAYETVCDNDFRRCNFYYVENRGWLIVTGKTSGDYFVTSISEFNYEGGCNVC